jgi:hypothetical protein
MTAPLLVTSTAAACGVVTSTTPVEAQTGYCHLIITTIAMCRDKYQGILNPI